MSKNPVRRVPFVGGPLDGQEVAVARRPILKAHVELPRVAVQDEKEGETQIVSVAFNEVLYILHQMTDGTYRYVVRGQQP